MSEYEYDYTTESDDDSEVVYYRRRVNKDGTYSYVTEKEFEELNYANEMLAGIRARVNKSRRQKMIRKCMLDEETFNNLTPIEQIRRRIEVTNMHRKARR